MQWLGSTVDAAGTTRTAGMKSPSPEDNRRPKSKLIQICASQNDLFALDADGIVYQYDFKGRMWERLDERRAFNAFPQGERR